MVMVKETQAKYLTTDKEEQAVLEKGACPDGYKLTEVGVIPEDWCINCIGSLTSEVSDGIHSTPIYSNSGDFFFVNGNNLINGAVVISDTTKRVAYEEYHKHKKKLSDRTILISINGTIGNIAYYKREPVILGKSAAFLNVLKAFSKEYLFYMLQTNLVSDFFEKGLTGTTIKNLGLGTIKNTPIPYPPCKAEQTAIAKALSDVDALISSLEKLIAKKQAIKTATMQQLLTGKKRLSGFGEGKGYKQTELGEIPEDWEVAPLSELTVLMTNGFVGTAKTHYTDSNSGVLYIQGYNVEENSFNFHGIKRVTQEFHKQHLKSCLREGDILTVQTGDVGLSTIIPKELVGANCHALIISRFKAENLVPKFFVYYLNSRKGRNRLQEIEIGTTMKHINVGDLLHFLVPYPSDELEQHCIVEVLFEMDKEIENIEKRLSKTQQIKQGMMQELLTGKTRLVKTKARDKHDR